MRIRTAMIVPCLVFAGATARAETPAPVPPTSRPTCLGAYAEDLSAMSARATEREAAAPSYSFAVRTAATYECVSYGSDSKLKRVTSTARAHGTAFGYRYDGKDTLLLTNEHVAAWPDVTDDEHAVDGVPSGCKRTSDSLSIVDNDRDDYTADDVPLTRVVVDPALDVAILRAHAKLPLLPWKVGKSASLASRDAVEVRGFPLGKFRATNTGKVVSTYDHDDQGVRNHDDFVIDALLASGGSGSPVLAVSCATNELELVGIFHSRYTGASALNVVIAIDQLRDLMRTLKRSAPRGDPTVELDDRSRARVTTTAVTDTNPTFFSLGPLTAKVHARPDGSLVFAIFSSAFPKTTRPVLVLEDLKAEEPKRFGRMGRIFVGGPTGLIPYSPAVADAEIQASLAAALDLLRRDALTALDNRDAPTAPAASKEEYRLVEKKKASFIRILDSQRGATQAIVDLSARLATTSTGKGLGLSEIEAMTAPVPAK